ncbi:MAG: hypothetical protein U0531_03290 [Dehalococcoidia bacterium]
MEAAAGIIANPVSGKDIRRLVAHASVFGNDEKGEDRPTGAARLGRDRGAVLVMPDPYGPGAHALDGAGVDLDVVLCPEPFHGREEGQHRRAVRWMATPPALPAS